MSSIPAVESSSSHTDPANPHITSSTPSGEPSASDVRLSRRGADIMSPKRAAEKPPVFQTISAVLADKSSAKRDSGLDESQVQAMSSVPAGQSSSAEQKSFVPPGETSFRFRSSKKPRQGDSDPHDFYDFYASSLGQEGKPSFSRVEVTPHGEVDPTGESQTKTSKPGGGPASEKWSSIRAGKQPSSRARVTQYSDFDTSHSGHLSSALAGKRHKTSSKTTATQYSDFDGGVSGALPFNEAGKTRGRSSRTTATRYSDFDASHSGHLPFVQGDKKSSHMRVTRYSDLEPSDDAEGDPPCALYDTHEPMAAKDPEWISEPGWAARVGFKIDNVVGAFSWSRFAVQVFAFSYVCLLLCTGLLFLTQWSLGMLQSDKMPVVYNDLAK
ncbi:hypothetical protein RBB50_005477 [Rhinocladiella similis]